MIAETDSQRVEFWSRVYLRGDEPGTCLYHLIRTIHQPSSNKSVACACCAVACEAGPRISQSHQSPSSPRSGASTLTARSCPAESDVIALSVSENAWDRAGIAHSPERGVRGRPEKLAQLPPGSRWLPSSRPQQMALPAAFGAQKAVKVGIDRTVGLARRGRASLGPGLAGGIWKTRSTYRHGWERPPSPPDGRCLRHL